MNKTTQQFCKDCLFSNGMDKEKMKNIREDVFCGCGREGVLSTTFTPACRHFKK